MTKTQKESIVAAILFILLVYLTWANLIRDPDRDAPPAVGNAEEIEEAPAPPGIQIPPDIETILELQEERMERDWGRDPFRGRPRAEEPEPVPEPDEREEVPELILRGIARMNGEKKALIGTEVVSEGEMVMGYKVIAIDESRVILRKEGREHEIRIIN